MLPTTYDALKSILRADPSISTSDRNRLLGLMRGGGTPAPAINGNSAPRVLSFSSAAERLNRSVRAVHLLAQQGILQKVRLPGRRRATGFLESDLAALIIAGPQDNNPKAKPCRDAA